jgi:ribosomal protein S18 acetylase RimI-like enzyme
VLQRSAGLSGAALDAIAELERRVLAVDGGRLKLEWGSLHNRPADHVNDVLWTDGDRLLGFAGIYQFGGSVPEITGMVDPAARRRGIGTTLLDAVSDVCRGRGVERGLLLVPRPSLGGHELAAKHGGKLDHSEHALVLDGEPTDGPSDPRISLRAASPDDADAVGAILAAAFDWTPDDLPALLARQTPRERTLVIERDGRTVGTVGTVRVTHDTTTDGDRGGIYGFAVHPDEQGRGIGRDVLRRCCRLLREEGAVRVGLEVAVENEHALGLYTSAGFRPVTTEDYYELRFA